MSRSRPSTIRITGLFGALMLGACAAAGGGNTTTSTGGHSSIATGGSTGSSGGAPATGTGGSGTGGGDQGTGGAVNGSGGTASGGAAEPGTGGTSTGGRSGTDGGIDSTVGTGGVAGETPDGGRADSTPGTLPNVILYLVGDSTVMDNGAGSAQEGWGMELNQFLTTQVTIDNRAIGGRSVQSWMYDDLNSTTESATWKSVKSKLKAGDYLMVQFGANDSSGIAGRAVTPADFETFLGVIVDAVKARQATPILVTPSALQQWVSGKETNTRLAPYAAAMIDLGPKKSVLVDDLNARSVEYLNMIGQTAAEQIYYMGDKAHFTKAGATQMSKLVASELKRIGSGLAAYLK